MWDAFDDCIRPGDDRRRAPANRLGNEILSIEARSAECPEDITRGYVSVIQRKPRNL